jgi:general stress protein YciG
MVQNNDNTENRGLASADEETRERVAKKGGEAPHEKRGLQAADEETRQRVASEGGKASHKNDNEK